MLLKVRRWNALEADERKSFRKRKKHFGEPRIRVTGSKRGPWSRKVFWEGRRGGVSTVDG